jgi:hypothetical protein
MILVRTYWFPGLFNEAHPESSTRYIATSSSTSKLARVMRRRCLSRGVPLPDFSDFAAWPDDWSFPRSSGGTHGVHPFAGFAPAAGGSASLHIRAHMPFSSRRPTRLIFVGLIRLARIA